MSTLVPCFDYSYSFNTFKGPKDQRQREVSWFGQNVVLILHQSTIIFCMSMGGRYMASMTNKIKILCRHSRSFRMDNQGISYCLKYFINNQIRKKKNMVYFNTCYSKLKINKKKENFILK